MQGLLWLAVASASFGMLSGVVSGWTANRIMSRKSQVLPSLPSYVEAVAPPHDEAVRFYAAVHDMAMTVTEAWNAVHSRTLGRPSLEQVLDKTRLKRHCDVVRTEAIALRTRLVGFERVMSHANTTYKALDQLWEYNAQHRSTTQMVPVMISNGQGGFTTTMQVQTVYSHTDHTFTPHAAALPAAAAQLQALFVTMQRGRMYQPCIGQRRVELAQLQPDQRSLAERLVRHNVLEVSEEVSADQVEDAVNQWLSGAGIDPQLADAMHALQRVQRHQSAALAATETADRHACQTRSRVDGGPESYRRVEALKSDLATAMRRYRAVYDTMILCSEIAEQLDGWSADAKTIEGDRAYVGRAIKAYESAFPGSNIDVDQVTAPGWPFVIGVSAGVLAAAVPPALTMAYYLGAYLL